MERLNLAKQKSLEHRFGDKPLGKLNVSHAFGKNKCIRVHAKSMT